MIDLNVIWFVLIVILITGYAILDGFDFGVGVLHLFARGDKERRIHLNAIGPVWDGNEVWLITGGGALFAAFPVVYATAFSGFYLALILLLAALIFRAVSLEFRSKVESSGWRHFWDWAFGLGSLLPAVLFGVAVGNVLEGVPIDANVHYLGTFLQLLNPYAILIGILSLVMFVMHGALYMAIKTEGEFQERMARWASGCWIAFVILYCLATFYSFFAAPHLFDSILSKPMFWIFFILLLASIIYIPLAIRAKRYFPGFLGSSLAIVCIIGLAAVSMFPKLMVSNIDMAHSLTIYNASSTPRTLATMLVIALIGMPIVLIYTIYIYSVFKGKTEVSEEGY